MDLEVFFKQTKQSFLIYLFMFKDLEKKYKL